MKKLFVLCISAGLLLALALPSLFAADCPVDATTLDYFPNMVVQFPHDAHSDLECQECHHKWDGEGEIQSCTAEGCHNVFDKKDRSVKSFYNIVHGRGSDEVQTCLGCHREEAKKNKDKRKELTSCKGSACHP